MKTGIITFHFVNNYGGALQAYALRRVISENLCEDTELIDYRHWFIRLTDAVRMLPITPNVRYYGPWFRSFGKIRKRRRKFADFMGREMHLSPRVNFRWQFRRIKDRYDIMICGSDQIWNPILTCGYARPYFLDFPMENARRISYAASLGGPSRGRERLLRGLKGLDAISVREKAEWLEEALDRPVQYHIDPTLLLTPEQWMGVARPPETGEKYILVYFMQRNETAYSIIDEIKRQTGLKVYDISRYGYRPDCVDRSLVDIGPEEFAGLFAGAEHVCTNSFHGLVFSLIFNKSVDYIPLQHFGGRIEHLCSLLDLSRVAVKDGAYYHIQYDPEEKERILEQERQKTFAYLKKEIELAHDQHT